MNVETRRRDLVNLLNELKEDGCTGIKVSTEDQGAPLEFIEFLRSGVIKDSLPIHVKIGGPDARNDIRKSIEIGAKGLIAPMIESPFGVHKFTSAVEAVLGGTIPDSLILSINLESVNAYEKIDAILIAPEIRRIDEIVIGVSDLAKSVGKPIGDPQVLEMVANMSIKSKREKKLVRVGGLMSLFISRPDLTNKILKETGVDEVNTTCIAYEVKRLKDIKAAYLKAINFELQLNELWMMQCEKRLEPFRRNADSLKKILNAKQ